MKVTFENSVLTVKTGLKVKTFEDRVGKAIAKDKDGNELFSVSQTPADCACPGSITEMSLVCNAVIDEELAVTIPVSRKTTKDDIRKQYGAALLVAQPYVDAISKNIEDAKAAFEKLLK